jgi:DNA-binding MarR family transcriptional regulator
METFPAGSSTAETGEPATMHREILVALRRIIRAVDLHSRQLMEGHGLTGPQLVALQALSRGGTLSARDLARTVHVSQATVTGILDRLERRALITRARSESDRRALDVMLTDEGRRVLAAAPPLLQQRFAEALAQLQGWEQTMILATLQRVATMMDAADLEARPHLITGPDSL